MNSFSLWFSISLISFSSIYWLLNLTFVLISRTLITGMVSGSIVAFNIDFNRWHYEHQNRYWAEMNPRCRKRVWRIKKNRLQTCDRAVLQKIRRVKMRSSALKNISMVTLKHPGVFTCHMASKTNLLPNNLDTFSVGFYVLPEQQQQQSLADLLFWAKRDLKST